MSCVACSAGKHFAGDASMGWIAGFFFGVGAASVPRGVERFRNEALCEQHRAELTTMTELAGGIAREGGAPTS